MPANKLKILIVDDSKINRMILTDMLENEYDILEAADGEEALDIVEKNLSDISLILLDNIMPKMTGLEVLSIMYKNKWTVDIPVIMISVESDRHLVDSAYDMGVVDYINQPFDVNTVHRRVKNTIMLYSKQKKLIGIIQEQIYQKEKNNDLMINILSHIVESRNGESGLHVIHVRVITELLLKKLCEMKTDFDIQPKDISLISMASSFHDIGKISIPLKILNKPGRLTPEEFDVIKGHSMMGAEMIDSFEGNNEPLVKYAYQIARWHHERFDGRGYPDGIKENEIPLSAQVVSIADVYDALTSERCYKKAIPHEKAIEMIKNNECGVFNPVLLKCLDSISEELKTELENSSHSKDEWYSAQNITKDLLQDNDIYVSIYPEAKKE